VFGFGHGAFDFCRALSIAGSNIPVVCDGVHVEAGDMVVADADEWVL